MSAISSPGLLASEWVSLSCSWASAVGNNLKPSIFVKEEKELIEAFHKQVMYKPFLLLI